MSRDMAALDPDFRTRVNKVLDECAERGSTLVPFYTTRHPREQARLYRQDKSTALIERQIDMLRDSGARWLSWHLESVGPQYGRWATNALPGQSWHQYGQAVDCYVRGPDGQAIWDAAHEGYSVYHAAATRWGLTNLGLRDAVHLQLSPGSPLAYYDSWAEIDAVMRHKWSGA